MADEHAPPRRSIEEIKAEARAFALSVPGIKKKKQPPEPEPLRYRPWTGPNATNKNVSSVGDGGAGTTLLASVTAASQTKRHASMEKASISTRPVAVTIPEPYVLPDLTHMDDYERFVQSLVLDLNLEEDHCKKLLDDDEEDEFLIDSVEDDEDDDEEEGESVALDGLDTDTVEATPESTNAAMESCTPLPLPLDLAESSLHSLEATDFYREIAEELCWLEEEDMEAAVATLLNHPNGDDRLTSPSHEPAAKDSAWDDTSQMDVETTIDPTTPTAIETLPHPSTMDSGGPLEPTAPYTNESPHMRSTSLSQHRTVATSEQYEQLKELMEKHYQLLVQQAVLAVRAANTSRYRRYASQSVEDDKIFDTQSGDSAEALVEALDGAVGMLQDLDENRKDAIRHQIQFEQSVGPRVSAAAAAGGALSSHQRSLFSELAGGNDDTDRPFEGLGSLGRRLTRAQFSKTLNQNGARVKTVFDIRGLSKLDSTFTILDSSVDCQHYDGPSYLNELSITDACEKLLNHGGSVIDTNLIPGKRDLSTSFVDENEIFGDKFTAPCTPAQEIILKKNRSFFTAGEDNLVLRGVNLYGEKQWHLICDRYLPERTINMISQRYGKLCFMLYKANGIPIDDDGNLPCPPKLESIDDVDPAAMATLHKISPPAILNVHRWSIEEDLMLLKAVAIMGSMWAELRIRLIPHRDRGHLRKRYQVLERRVKATAARNVKQEKSMTARLKTQEALTAYVSDLPHPDVTPQMQADISARLKSDLSAKPPTRATLAIPQARAAPGAAQTRAAPAVPQAQILPFTQPRVPGNYQGVPQSRAPTAKKVAPKIAVASSKPTAIKAQPTHTSAKKHVATGAAKPKPSATMAAANQPPSSEHAPPPYYYHPAYLYQPHYHPPVPYHYYPPYYTGYPDDGSRAAYEQLVHDPSKDWSQMSHVRNMMENDESAVASTIVTQLAKSPAKAKPPTASETPHSKPTVKAPPSTGKATRSSPRHLAVADSPNKRKSPPSKSTQVDAASPGTPLDHPSPTIRLGFSPQNSLFNEGGITSAFPVENSNLLYPQFSQQGHTMDGYDINGVFSNPGPKMETSPQGESALQDRDGIKRFGDGALLMENDMEAVSALNLLKTPTKTMTVERRRTSARKTAEKKSLFARVVGNAEEKEKSRRKRRKVR